MKQQYYNYIFKPFLLLVCVFINVACGGGNGNTTNLTKPDTGNVTTLTITKSGSGTITGTGINCGLDCTEQFTATNSVTLLAMPDSGFNFTEWSGDCNGQGSCALSMDKNHNVSATFSPQATVDCSTITTHCVDDTAGVNQEFSTIQSAVDVAKAGDTVLVFDGIYTSGFRVSTNGTITKRLVIKANASSAVITGSEALSNESIYINNTHYITIEGFTILRAGQTGIGIGAHRASPTNPMLGLIIRNNIVRDSDSVNIYLSQVASSLVEGNTTSGSKNSHGIYLSNGGSDNTILRNNNSYNNAINGIHFNGDASVGEGTDGLQTGLILENNIIHDNVVNGVSMDGVQSTIIRNNLIYNNGRHAIRGYKMDASSGPKNLTFINNTFVVNNDNNSYPIKLSEESGGHVFFNNILTNNSNGSGIGSISVESGNFASNNNIVLNAFTIGSINYTLSDWKKAGYGINSILSSTPTELFVNLATHDYHSKVSSLSIDNGIAKFNNKTASASDLDKQFRPIGNGYDIGVYEQ